MSLMVILQDSGLNSPSNVAKFKHNFVWSKLLACLNWESVQASQIPCVTVWG